MSRSPEPKLPFERSESENVVLQARKLAPSATAGQLGIPAPHLMSERQLLDQCVALVGKVVVYSLRASDEQASPFKSHAGTVEKNEAGDGYVVRASAANNNLHGVEQHMGSDVLYSFPAAGFSYCRILDAAVWQTEKAAEVIGQLHQENRVKDAQILQQQARLVELLETRRLPDFHHTDQAMAQQDPVTDALFFPAEALEVQAWVQDIADDPRGLITAIESKYVSGLVHLQGGKILWEAFENLRLWILATAYFSGWERTPQCDLGNKLWESLRVQHQFVTRGVSRRQLMDQLQHVDPKADPVVKAANIVLQRKKKTQIARIPATASSSWQWKKPQLSQQHSQGNGVPGRK